MTEDDWKPEDRLREAEALIVASHHCSDDARHDQLLAWAREIIAPLLAARHPHALWVVAGLPSAEGERISDEEYDRRYWQAVRQAAEAGVLSAKFTLACELDNQALDNKDQAKAEESARLFAEAAKGGHAYAKWCHGLDLISGKVIEKDEALGLTFIREAAEQKFEGAIQFMADAYAAGTFGYPKDEGEAARWRKRLSDKGLITY